MTIQKNEKTDKKTAGPTRLLFPKGSTIFKEGEKAEAAYILESGNVQIFKMIGGRRVQLGLVRQWAIFGELGIIDEAPRMAAAYAVEDSVCVVLTRDALAQMLDGAPQGLVVLIRSLAQTLRDSGEELGAARFQLLELENR